MLETDIDKVLVCVWTLCTCTVALSVPAMSHSSILKVCWTEVHLFQCTAVKISAVASFI